MCPAARYPARASPSGRLAVNPATRAGCAMNRSASAIAIMGAVDNSHYSLVIAAAQAAGPCPPGEEAAWGRRVHGLTVDLHLIAQQARQDIERLESARTFIAFLEKVEIEESSRRGLLTLRLPSGESGADPHRAEGHRPRAGDDRAGALPGGTLGAGLPVQRAEDRAAEPVGPDAGAPDGSRHRRGRAQCHGEEDGAARGGRSRRGPRRACRGAASSPSISWSRPAWQRGKPGNGWGMKAWLRCRHKSDNSKT